MKILRIEEFNAKKNCLYCENGESLVIYKTRWNPEKTEITESEYDLLKDEMLQYGKRYAMHLLEKKDYFRAELISKLQKEGYINEIQEKILQYLDSFHYLDDIRYAGILIRGRKNRKSKIEIEYLLKRKGVTEETITQAMQLNYQDDYDYEETESPEINAVRLQLQKYHLTEEQMSDYPYEEKQKLAAKLYRRGFSKENIKRVLHF